MVVCRRCCGEVCSVISEEADAAAGAEEDSAVVEVLAAVVALVAGLAEVEALAAAVRAAVGDTI